MTNLAMYSLITGTYPPPGSPIIRYRFKADGLADVLLEHGYETSFIESYDLQWNGPHDERMLRQLGFATIRDAIQLAGPRHAEWDSYRIELESRAFDAALEDIAGAASRGRKAFVCVETNLGHYDWLRPPHAEHMSATDRIAYTVKTLDALFGRFLGGLAARGLADDILIVVTGDHGLRFKMEFDSVSMPVTYADLVFNVPFIAYSPGIFGAQVRLPYPTSHADIAPTVLDLLGIGHDERLYLGNNMLDRRLADRIVFLPSASFAGLYPADAFRWKDQIYSLHRIVDRVAVRDAHGSPFVSRARPTLPLSEDETRRIMDGAREVFEDTAAYFRRRFTQKPAGSASRE
jgi:phosphoglycerol transferase MdoB-like AlkP superfamily enzyme